MIWLGNSVYSLGFLGSLGAGLRSIAGGEVTQVTQVIHDGRPAAGFMPLKFVFGNVAYSIGLGGSLANWKSYYSASRWQVFRQGHLATW